MEELRKLIQQRGRVKAKVTGFGNFLNTINTDPRKVTVLKSREEKAEALWAEFELIQNKIKDLDESEEQAVQRNNFKDSYNEIISRARNIAAGNQIAQPINVQPGMLPIESLAIRPNVKLPNIELPKFDGNYERWIPFRDLFESLIAANAALSPVQKLHYLRSALSGEATKIITSLELTNDNYEIAWRLLKQRHENKGLIIQYLIQSLCDL